MLSHYDCSTSPATILRRTARLVADTRRTHRVNDEEADAARHQQCADDGGEIRPAHPIIAG
jgi:hypothetical protein